MDKILSIIVPSYNVEKYISKCLDSLIVEEIIDDIEVLIVNDGSKDSTVEIAKEYCNRYPETFILRNKENGGHGSTINCGIKHATGKYFKVLDGDDWLYTSNLVEYIDLLKQRDEDIIASDYLCIKDGTEEVFMKKSVTSMPERYGNAFSLVEDAIEDVIKMHALTIKTKILQEHNILIDEHCYYVDCEYIAYPIPFCTSVYYDKHDIYCYRLGRNGQSVDIKSMQKNRKQHERVFNALLSFYDNLPEISENKKRYIERIIGQVMENQFQIYISMGLRAGMRDELVEWDRRLKNKHMGVYTATDKLSIMMLRKTHYFILPFGTIIYRLIKDRY